MQFRPSFHFYTLYFLCLVSGLPSTLQGLEESDFTYSVLDSFISVAALSDRLHPHTPLAPNKKNTNTASAFFFIEVKACVSKRGCGALLRGRAKAQLTDALSLLHCLLQLPQ